MQFYESLGLEPKLSLDADDLKKRFYERSRQWHPDRFSRASAEEQQKALDMTALLNDAFRTLKDPVTRAEYFLKEKGLELSKDAPPELLEEVFELNMALEELREGDDSARPQLVAAQEKFSAMRAEIDGRLVQLFEAEDLDGIHAALNRRRYISNLVREVDKELSVHVSN
jgi:molecular chaperone HscB